jgi:hypothetical protein
MRYLRPGQRHVTSRFRVVILIFGTGLLAATSCWGQAVVYSLEATAGDLAAGEHSFGFKDEASDGPDVFDAPEPPVPLESFLSLAFAMPDTSFPYPNRWRSDIRNSQSFVDQVEIWELHFETDQIGTECLVSLDVIEGGEFDIDLRVIGLFPDDIIVPVPGQFTFLLTDAEMVVWLEMSSDGPVAVEEESWGDIKVRYR